jgi:hypothetical protein
MCRSIRTLRPPAVEDVTIGDVEAAARQYVRKLSGFRDPAEHNREAFDRAVAEIAASTRTLLESLDVRGQDPIAVIDGPERKPPSRPRPA